MKLLLLLGLLALSSVSAAYAGPVEIGMTEAALVQQKGQPANKLTVGTKSVYQWPDVSVTIKGGKVESFKLVDPRTTREGEAARQKAKAGTNPNRGAGTGGSQKRAGAPAEAPDPTDAEEKRLTDAIAKKSRITNLESQIRDMEAQLDGAAKRIYSGKKSTSMSADQEALLRLRLEKAKRELEKLR